MSLPMRRVTTRVSELKSNNACTGVLKKNVDKCGSTLSLLRIIVILFNTSLARDKLLTTAGQFPSANKITCHKYWKEITISRGRS